MLLRPSDAAGTRNSPSASPCEPASSPPQAPSSKLSVTPQPLQPPHKSNLPWPAHTVCRVSFSRSLTRLFARPHNLSSRPRAFVKRDSPVPTGKRWSSHSCKRISCCRKDQGMADQEVQISGTPVEETQDTDMGGAEESQPVEPAGDGAEDGSGSTLPDIDPEVPTRTTFLE